MSHTHQYTATVEKKPKSLAVVSVEVGEETLTTHRAQALKALGESVAIDGFRTGHIPEKVLVGKVGEMAVLTEAAEIVIRHIYPHILDEHSLDAIGTPEIAITKLAPGNPLLFTITVSLVPEVTISDYKRIAAEHNKKKELVLVSEKDIDEAVERIQRQKMAYENLQEKARKRKEALDAGLSLSTPETAAEDAEAKKLLLLPPLTDEYVKSLGTFQTVEEFKSQLRSHIQSEKENEISSKHRASITDEIIDTSTIDLPDLLVESEISQIFAEMEADITRAGLKIEDYLAHVKKTRDDLHREWTPVAEKRAKLQLILNHIADAEKIEADTDRVEHETKNLLAQFKDADEARARLYVTSLLRNEAVMQMLEKIV